MALTSGLVTGFTGLNIVKPLVPVQRLTVNTSVNYRKTHLAFRNYFVRGGNGANYAIPVGRRNHEFGLHNDGKEPFWLAPTEGFIRGLKSMLAFLAEQPSQLKYIEWPGFQNTLKTASLTLVLVAMLIVVLSSVESGLWYLLALILRRPA
ncbi:uncharacterized protein [Rutidosis leptorrhynchoides]|uniref:uncharacterized protein isoform X2 n=1 Tax=Rutidosis leptorrhynchoides TaxID=125765 RepID=UPI003A9948D2